MRRSEQMRRENERIRVRVREESEKEQHWRMTTEEPESSDTLEAIIHYTWYMIQHNTAHKYNCTSIPVETVKGTVQWFMKPVKTNTADIRLLNLSMNQTKKKKKPRSYISHNATQSCHSLSFKQTHLLQINCLNKAEIVLMIPV